MANVWHLLFIKVYFRLAFVNLQRLQNLFSFLSLIFIILFYFVLGGGELDSVYCFILMYIINSIKIYTRKRRKTMYTLYIYILVFKYMLHILILICIHKFVPMHTNIIMHACILFFVKCGLQYLNVQVCLRVYESMCVCVLVHVCVWIYVCAYMYLGK